MTTLNQSTSSSCFHERACEYPLDLYSVTDLWLMLTSEPPSWKIETKLEVNQYEFNHRRCSVNWIIIRCTKKLWVRVPVSTYPG